MTSKFILHSSSLPTWNDCEGRWAASNIRSLRNSLHGGRTSAASVIGTVFHAAMKRALLAKMELGLVLDFNELAEEAEHALIEAYRKGDGVLPDEVTRNLLEAKYQLSSLIREALWSYVRFANPVEVEPEDLIDIRGADWLALSYRPDVVVNEGFIDDFKTFRQLSDYKAQAGSYVLGREGRAGVKAKGFRILGLKRVSASSAPSELQIIEYDREACLDAALQAIREIKLKLPVWEEKKSFKIFRMNPNSKLCTKTTCRAWGSDLCNQWTDKK